VGFFSFKKMVAVSSVRIIYFVVFLGINLGALVLLLNQFIFRIIVIPEIAFLESQPLLWPILFFALHLIWRLLCEAVVVVFKIYETLVSIEFTMKEGELPESTMSIEPETPSTKLRTREEFRKWKERSLRLLTKRQKGIEGNVDDIR
jgi:hypothetical protein